MLDSLFAIRDMEETDTGYVMQTWLDDLRKADRGFLPNDIWFPAHRECIDRVLARTSTRVKILCDIEDPRVIIGYIVCDDAFIYWLHIRRGNSWRNRGLAKYLMEQTLCLSHELVWPTKLGHERLKNPVATQRARRVMWASD